MNLISIRKIAMISVAVLVLAILCFFATERKNEQLQKQVAEAGLTRSEPGYKVR